MATTTINWFPGHMRKTQREIKENLKLVEAIIEIRDARIPRSSANPDIEKPFLSTVGCFLDKINNNYRKEIIEKLIKLQTGQIKPEKVKVFNNDIFSKMSLEEFGEKQGETIQFDKFFKKYYEQEEELEAE